MTWPEPNGHEEEYVPFAQRPGFRMAALLIILVLVLGMLALTLGPYLSRPRVVRVPVTTTLLAQSA